MGRLTASKWISKNRTGLSLGGPGVLGRLSKWGAKGKGRRTHSPCFFSMGTNSHLHKINKC